MMKFKILIMFFMPFFCFSQYIDTLTLSNVDLDKKFSSYQGSYYELKFYLDGTYLLKIKPESISKSSIFYSFGTYNINENDLFFEENKFSEIKKFDNVYNEVLNEVYNENRVYYYNFRLHYQVSPKFFNDTITLEIIEYENLSCNYTENDSNFFETYNYDFKSLSDIDPFKSGHLVEKNSEELDKSLCELHTDGIISSVTKIEKEEVVVYRLDIVHSCFYSEIKYLYSNVSIGSFIESKSIIGTKGENYVYMSLGH